MKPFICVPISTELYQRVVDLLRVHGSQADPATAIDIAIESYCDRAHWNAEDLVPGKPGAGAVGYQWKQLFLPHLTTVRMRYNGRFYYGKVEGDLFLYEGKSMSPAEFANLVANNTSRNAWRDLWVKRPGDADYQLADALRSLLDAGNPKPIYLIRERDPDDKRPA